MARVRVASFAVSLDGFGAGPDQSLEHPLGVGGTALHEWAFPTRTFQQRIFGRAEGETGVDDDWIARGFRNVGAWILGRNMFGPVRGRWPDEQWRGWWGEEPPYRVPVFVLTNHARAPIEMRGGTIFRFVTDGFRRALELATEAADGRDVRIGGGPATVRQYLRAGLVDEMHLAYAPTLLGRGESLFDGVDLAELDYRVTEYVAGKRATHVLIRKMGSEEVL